MGMFLIRRLVANSRALPRLRERTAPVSVVLVSSVTIKGIRQIERECCRDCQRCGTSCRTSHVGRLRKFTIWATSGSALGIPRLHRYNVIVPWRGGRTPKEAPMGNADRAQGLGHRLRNSQKQTVHRRIDIKRAFISYAFI